MKQLSPLYILAAILLLGTLFLIIVTSGPNSSRFTAKVILSTPDETESFTLFVGKATFARPAIGDSRVSPIFQKPACYNTSPTNCATANIDAVLMGKTIVRVESGCWLADIVVGGYSNLRAC